MIGFASQQLNHLLSHKFSPKDVMDQVTLSMAYTSRLLAKFTKQPLLTEPLREQGRKPSDVYYRLSECYGELGEIAKHANINMLKLSDKNLDRPNVHPNDVYDLASLLVLELLYLNRFIPKSSTPKNPRAMGPILPSHVHQKAGSLYAQLKALNKQIQADPQWLK